MIFVCILICIKPYLLYYKPRYIVSRHYIATFFATVAVSQRTLIQLQKVSRPL